MPARNRSLSDWTAILTGAIFIPAGLVKFVFHGWELHAFRTFGLPWPVALVIVAGVIETIGGILLVLRRAIVPTAAILAVTMVVAIGVSGIGHGDVIPSLTLAPALLVSTTYLLLSGAASSVSASRARPSRRGSSHIPRSSGGRGSRGLRTRR